MVSQARTPLEFDEFINVIKLLRSNKTILGAEQFETSCILSILWYLIARIDNLMKMKFDNITNNVQIHFTLMCKMRGSKKLQKNIIP